MVFTFILRSAREEGEVPLPRAWKQAAKAGGARGRGTLSRAGVAGRKLPPHPRNHHVPENVPVPGARASATLSSCHDPRGVPCPSGGCLQVLLLLQHVVFRWGWFCWGWCFGFFFLSF